MNSEQRRIIAELNALNFPSVEFYDAATAYFRLRLRVLRNCGAFFLFLAVLDLAFGLIEAKNSLSVFKFCSSALFCVIIGLVPYQIGNLRMQMIKAARKGNTQCQLDALRRLAKGSFRCDPVGATVLQRFGDGV
jgi:hypothetical protein